MKKSKTIKPRINLLLITFEFPPCGGGTVQRLTKIVKYLPQNGIYPTVLTAKPRYYSQLDESYLRDIPRDVKVYRIDTFFSLSYTNKIRQKSVYENSFQVDRNINLYLKILWFLRNNFLIPDTQILWLTYVLLKIRKILIKEKIDIVYATSGPNSVSLIGAIITLIFNRTFVSEFRDPWVQWKYRIWENNYRKYVETKMEQWIVRRSKLIVTTTEAMQKYYQRISGPSCKSICIYNGFDSVDFRNLKLINNEVFTFVYTGKIVPDLYSPLPLLESIKKVVNKCPRQFRSFKIVFIGDFPEIYRDWISANEMNEYVDIKGYLPHREALSYQLGADILLLFLEPNVGVELTISGKFFEYLFARKFIIGIMPEDSRVNFEIKKFGVGRVFPHHQIDELYNFLTEILVQRKDYLIKIDKKNQDFIFFEWENQLKMLSQHLLKLSKIHG